MHPGHSTVYIQGVYRVSMLAFAGLLSSAAREAGIKLPPEELLDDPDESWDSDEYPHFTVFCNLQLAGMATAAPKPGHIQS